MSHTNVQPLVAELVAKERELADLGSRIRKSGHVCCVAFIDLVGSTALKIPSQPDHWLGQIHTFVAGVTTAATAAGGRVVKRVGDGVMVTFDDVATAESCLMSLAGDEEFVRRFPFKAAADLGSVYFLDFEGPLSHDPYGTVVDRCAHLAASALPGLVLASSSYAEGASSGSYALAGEFRVKGIEGLHKIYFRPLIPVDSSSYLEPLVAALSTGQLGDRRYRYVVRRFVPMDFKGGRGAARPFLAHELLNVPRLPHSLSELTAAVESRPRDEWAEFVGYIVEWDVSYHSYKSLGSDGLLVSAHDPADQWRVVHILLPGFAGDVVRGFNPGDVLRVRGVLTDLDGLAFTLNYAELATRDALPASGM